MPPDTGKTSVSLPPKVARALAWLRQQPGGFNLSLAVRQVVMAAARSAGWRDTRKKEE